MVDSSFPNPPCWVSLVLADQPCLTYIALPRCRQKNWKEMRSQGLLWGKWKRILVCCGVVGWQGLISSRRKINYWISGRSVALCFRWLAINVASHILKSVCDITRNFGSMNQAIFHNQLLRRCKIFSSTTCFFFFLNLSANKTSVLK